MSLVMLSQHHRGTLKRVIRSAPTIPDNALCISVSRWCLVVTTIQMRREAILGMENKFMLLSKDLTTNLTDDMTSINISTCTVFFNDLLMKIDMHLKKKQTSTFIHVVFVFLHQCVDTPFSKMFPTLKRLLSTKTDTRIITCIKGKLAKVFKINARFNTK